MLHSNRPFLFLILLGLLGCSASEDAETVSPEAERQAFMNSVAGRYAHFDIVAYEDVIMDMEMFSLVVTYGFTTLEVVDNELVSTDRFCHADMPSNLDIENVVSDALTQAIVPKSVTVSVLQDGDRWGYHRPETPTPLGIEMEDVNVPLPTDATDPRIVDADGDGKPGVTAKLILFGADEAEIYMIRKEVFAYTLYQQDDASFTGVVEDRSEQVVIGADPIWLNVPSNPEQHADLTYSPIRLIPLTEGEDEYGCEDLLRDAPTLFPEPVIFW